ncbi:type VII secretion system-associated protein [Streptomyces sp. JH34]|uniref:type VII secretion system-associated protein n=1 Tax=Streptomyces sp. JH34 TaxID=2793633 RepID=UPI0023F67E64|nr:type VII secretion system-associated protein [Streptomyces sp. JH34]MDF6018279.1 type VII secretion system-associated protein [Streptomyces sp. JH34]
MPEAPDPAAGRGVNATEDTVAADIPEAVKAAARRAPGHWIGVVDPEWTEERTPAEWAVLGEWQSDESGEVGEYRPNPAYRPSARMLGWPEPTDPVDAAAQRAATGYGSVEEALAALAEADVTVARGPEGGPLTAAGRDGAPVVLLFTSPAHEFMSSALHHDRLPVQELSRSLKDPGTMLMVNAGAAAPLLVPARSLPGGPARAEGDTWAPAAEYGSASAAADPVGTEAAEPAADRTDSTSEHRPHTTGRTP